MCKRTVTICSVILAGLILGVLAKIGDVIPQGNIIFNFISGFGRASSGFTLWIFACLLISNKSENRKFAAVNVITFLLAMLIAYYSYSKFVVGYLSLGIVKFWILMIIPSAVAGYIVHGIKNKKVLKIVVAVAAVCLGAFGIVFIEGLETYSLIIEGVLFLLIGIILFKSDKK